jgi:putative membrane protein
LGGKIMTRWMRYATLAVIAIALIVFASANRDLVTVHLLPADLALLFALDVSLDMPVFLLVFLGIVLGLVVGFIWEWLREHKHRSLARGKSREVTKLERELAAMKDQTSLPEDDVLALLEKPKR